MTGASDGKLLERTTELDALERALNAAASGTGHALVIEGPAGIGKSRLLDSTRTRADQLGLGVLMTRCGELEQDVAWGTARRLLAPAVQERTAADRAALMADAAGLAAPALGGGSPTATPVDEAAVSHGLYWLVAALAAERPLAILVDDAHWSDSGSLRWLASMAVALQGLPLALIAAIRPGEPGAERHAAVTLVSTAEVEVLHPRPLSPAAVEQRIAELLHGRPDRVFSTTCHELTAGNPFLVEELMHQLARDGVTPSAEEAERVARLRPEAVRRHVVLRLARLEPTATALAQSVAVLGGQADVEIAATVAELGQDEVESAFAALVRTQVLANETPLRFVHPLVQAAVYDELPAVERNRAHYRAARTLDAGDALREEVSGHLLRTDPAGDDWTRDVLLDAGRGLLARGAPEDALRLLRRADREVARDGRDGGLPLLLGRAEFAARGAQGLDGLRRAWSVAGSDGARAEAALVLGRALHAVGNHPEATRVYEDTLAGDLEDGAAGELRDELIMTALQDRSTFASAQAGLMKAGERMGAGEPASPTVLAALALAAAAAGQGEANALAEEALASGELLAEPNAIPLGFAITALTWCDQLERARELWDGAMAAAQRGGSRPWFEFCACFRAHVAWRLGDVPEAELFARDGVSPAEQWDLVPPDPAAYLADALIEQGRLAEAERTLEESGYDRSMPERQGYNTLLFTRARLHIASGRKDEGVADLRELGRRLDAWTLVSPSAFPWRSALAEAVFADDPDEARSLAADELELADAAGADRALGNALRVSGLVARDAERLELLSRAVETLRRSPARLDRARALTDLGAALRRAGQRRDAQPVLREALDLATRCGATALEQRAREELVTAGARPRRSAIHGQASLTAAELRIARMAADGLTNRQIGQALFVTLRTVETHLTHIYRKLDIRSRRELAGSLDV